MPQCAGIKRDGGRCAVVVGPGQSHCYAHDPTRAEELRRNASRGGRTRGNGELPDLKKQLKDLAAGVLDGTAALEFIAHQWAQGYQDELYGPPTDPAVVEMAEHEHDAYEFIDKATGERWLKDLPGSERWEAANGT